MCAVTQCIYHLRETPPLPHSSWGTQTNTEPEGHRHTQTHLVMAGLEGAPSAVESHLHRGEGQVGHEIFTALHVAVLHLEEKAQIRKEHRKRSVTANRGDRQVLQWLERKSCMFNRHHKAFEGNYPTPYRDGNGGE